MSDDKMREAAREPDASEPALIDRVEYFAKQFPRDSGIAHAMEKLLNYLRIEAALTTPTQSANGEFRVECNPPHFSYDDPVVEPASTAERDAARYQWLRGRLHGIDFMYGEPPIPVLTFVWPIAAAIWADLDAAIDAAMKVSKA